jgi:glycerophosphoryl diester phosphodiesterase
VVLHDAHYPDGRLVWDTPAEDRPDGVPLLDEALDACAPLLVNVEIKNIPGDLGDGVPHDPANADAVIDLLRSRWSTHPGERIVVSSFDPATLGRVRDRSDLVTAMLVFDLSADPQVVERAAEDGHAALNPWDPFVDASLVERCRGVGLGVNTWTVDDPVRQVELAALGVDGIITNVPAVARDALSGDR